MVGPQNFIDIKALSRYFFESAKHLLASIFGEHKDLICLVQELKLMCDQNDALVGQVSPDSLIEYAVGDGGVHS